MKISRILARTMMRFVVCVVR